MQQQDIRILTTSPLPQEAEMLLYAAGIQLTTEAFIETKTVEEPALTTALQAVPPQATVVISSSNALKAICELLPGRYALLKWNIFCIEGSTRDRVIHTLPQSTVVQSAAYAEDLARHIIDSRPDMVYFLCGDKRLPALPAMLMEAGIRVAEIILYRNCLLPVKLAGSYDAYLFSSPSAIESFFTYNTIPPGAQPFCIGTTTAAALRQFTDAACICPSRPGKTELAKAVIQHFFKQEQA